MTPMGQVLLPVSPKQLPESRSRPTARPAPAHKSVVVKVVLMYAV